MYAPSTGLKMSRRTSDNISIFAAEIEAIKIALNLYGNHLFSSNALESDPLQNLVIFTDSLSAVKALDICHNFAKSHYQQSVVQTTTNLFRNRNVVCKLVWILSHIGVQGNETADVLAKTATTYTEIQIDVTIETPEYKKIIKSKILNEWQNTWKTVEINELYRKLVPLPSLISWLFLT